jgi:enterochelin esterase-like enzyme
MEIPLYIITALFILLLFQWRARRARAELIQSVALTTLVDFPSALTRKREIQIFLPPGYDQETEERYPVLYLNDGQDAAALGLRETMAQLIQRGKIRPFIAVAIPTDEARLQEYGTAVAANAQGYGSQAAAYSQFIIEELRPAINEQFRTMTSPAQTAILGASLGGLSAFDIGWYHPQWIGIIGVMSGSFWWRAGGKEAAKAAAKAAATAPNRRIAHEGVRQTAVQPNLRVWLQAATLDETADRDNNGVIDAIQDTRELMAEMSRLGFREGADMVYVEVVGGRHDYDTWSRLLPDFLQWAFPAHPRALHAQRALHGSNQ